MQMYQSSEIEFIFVICSTYASTNTEQNEINFFVKSYIFSLLDYISFQSFTQSTNLIHLKAWK